MEEGREVKEMIRALTLAAALIALSGVPVAAQMICGNRAEMIKKLEDRWGELQIWAGLADGRVMELWVACPDGTWTILRTSPRGLTCIVTVGDGWRGEPCKAEGTPA